jgi:hypothetical protein
VQLDSLQAGSHAVDTVLAVIQDPSQVQASDPRVRGILGSDSLEHLDMLIDYPHSLLCLDDGKLMQANVKGAHIALQRPPPPENNLPFTESPMVPVHVSGMKEQLLLLLDSGSNAPMLYEAGQELAGALAVSVPLRTRGADGIERELRFYLRRMCRSDSCLLSDSLCNSNRPGERLPKVDFDGLLPTVLFQRVFMSYTDHYVVLDPW